ncbi:hypothetical protein QIH97_gp36 [Enterobacter phage KNP3]|nr:hypothetical protein QIH97_gp36 [Enterobacter phage KNP3]
MVTPVGETLRTNSIQVVTKLFFKLT